MLVASLVLGDVEGALDCLGDRRAKRAGGVGIVLEHLLADLGRVGRRRRDGRIEGLHDRAAEGLLLVGALHHEDVEVDAVMVGRLGKRGAPLAGTGLGRDLVEALLLGVVGLGERRVELVRAGGVVASNL